MTSPVTPAATPRLPPGLALLRLKFRILSTLSTEWAFAHAWKLFTTPRRLPVKGWEAPALRNARPFEVAVGGERVQAYEWNPAGPRTVLLVHGWEHRGSFWGVAAQALVAAGFRVVALDGPAHGASTGIRTTLPAFAQAVQAVADALGEMYGVVAHSFGGAATVGVPVHFNQATGGLLPRLVLLAVPGSTTAVAHRFAELLQLPVAVLNRMHHHIQQQLGRNAESFSLVQVGRNFPVGRALLLHDEQDESIPFAEAREIAAGWPGLELQATTGLGHNRIMRDPAVLQRVVEFLG
jgi:pimeloyl-ACP methyl ester carboxylesterase